MKALTEALLYKNTAKTRQIHENDRPQGWEYQQSYKLFENIKYNDLLIILPWYALFHE